MPKIDWKDLKHTEEEASKPAPAGAYVIETVRATWGESKGGAPMITLILQIAEGPYKGKSVWNYLTFDGSSAGALRMARVFLEMSGTNFDNFGELTEQQQLDYLIGKKYEVDLKVDSFQGRDSNKIKSLNRGVTVGSTNGVTPPPPRQDAPPPVAPINPLDGV